MALEEIKQLFVLANIGMTLLGLGCILLVRLAYRQLRNALDSVDGNHEPHANRTLAAAVSAYVDALRRRDASINPGALAETTVARLRPIPFLPVHVGAYVRFVRAATSVCVVIGLLGTFVGLYFALDGVGGALTEAAKNASQEGKEIASLLKQLQSMIGGMSTAFLASIYGVGGSLVLTLASAFAGTYTLGDEVAADLEHYLCNRLEPGVMVGNSQEVQFALLNRMEELVSTLEAGLSSSLAEAAEQFSDTAAKMAKVIEGISPITQTLGTSGVSLAALSKSLDSVTADLQKVMSSLQKNQGSVSDRMDQLKSVEAELLAALKQIQSSLRLSDEQVIQLTAGVTAFRSGAAQMEKALQDFATQWPEIIQEFVTRTDGAVQRHTLGVSESIEHLREIIAQSRNDTLSQMEALVKTNQTIADAIAQSVLSD